MKKDKLWYKHAIENGVFHVLCIGFVLLHRYIDTWLRNKIIGIDMRFWYMILVVWLQIFVAQPVHAQATTVQEQYDLGQKYLNRGYYTKALEQFNLIRNNYRDDPLARMAELAIADVYYKKAEWDLARYSYDDFLNHYPYHEKADYASFQVGMTFYKKSPRFAGRDQKWTMNAVQSWKNFDKKYPESEYQADVKEKSMECLERLAKKELQIAIFYSKRKAWDAVRRRSSALIAVYPNSVYVHEARELLIVALVEQQQLGEAQMHWNLLQQTHPNRAEELLKKYSQLR